MRDTILPNKANWTLSSQNSLPKAKGESKTNIDELKFKSVRIKKSSPCKHQMGAISARLSHIVRRFYRFWAFFVSQHSTAIIVFCVLISVIGTAKMATTKRRNNIRGYTPYGSRSLYEFDVRDEFFDQSGTGIRFIVVILPRNATPVSVERAGDGSHFIVRNNELDGGGENVLEINALAETVYVDNIIQKELPIFNRKTRKNESFAEICRLFCNVNEPVQAFYSGMKHQLDRLSRNDSQNRRIYLSYPVSQLFGRDVNLLPNFFDVKMRNESITTKVSNTKSMPTVTNIERVGMIVLLYRAERIGGWTDEDIFNYEMSISEYFKTNYTGNHIRVHTISSSYVAQEVDRAGQTLRPFVGIGFCVMLACSVVTCTLSALYMRQFTAYKIILAMFACICPFMASGTALGILFYFGLRHSSILSVSPFLILALGVDDAFLTIHAWQNICKRSRNSDGRIETSIENRLSVVLEETGPAILISALTNIMADAVGSFTGSPEITLLCVANIASIIVDFFYQITFFTSVLIIVARKEEAREKKMTDLGKLPSPSLAIASTTIPIISLTTKVFDLNQFSEPPQASNNSDSNPESAIIRELRVVARTRFARCVDAYIHCITNSVIAACTCVIWIIFLAFCVKAMLGFEINLTTHKLFVRDSPLLEIETYREEKVLPSYTMAQLFVNQPGNLSDPNRLMKLNRLIADMEALPYAFGTPEGTSYFMRDFMEFEENLIGDNSEERESEDFVDLVDLEFEKEDTNNDGIELEDKKAGIAEEKSSMNNVEEENLAKTPKENSSSLEDLFQTLQKLNKNSAENFFDFPLENFANESSNRRSHVKNSDADGNSLISLIEENRSHLNRTELSTPNSTSLTTKTLVQTLNSSRPKRDIAQSMLKNSTSFNMEADLKTFLNWPEYSHWKTFLKYHLDSESYNENSTNFRLILDSVMIIVGFHGEELKDWYKRAKMLEDWRRVVDVYAEEFNVSVLHDEGLYLDLLENMTTDIWQSLVATLFCMAAICILFMNSKFVVFVATIVIASIMIATLGIMALQNMTIDPVVMAAVIISLGFSVDIPAHISYHFHISGKKFSDNTDLNKVHQSESLAYNKEKSAHATKSESLNKQQSKSSEDRIRSAFSSVGFPAIQASICMNICVLCLLLVPVYMAQVFVRVMCLCSTLCAVHSFVLLPALFSTVDAISASFTRMRAKHNLTTAQ